VIPEIPER